MRVALGADHGGFELKEELKTYIRSIGHGVLDVGSRKLDPGDDYTEFSHSVASALSEFVCDRGIIICTTGAGTCVVANKYSGIRAVECACIDDVKHGREHLDMNVMTIGSLKVHRGVARDMVDAFLGTKAVGGRHRRRREKIEPHAARK